MKALIISTDDQVGGGGGNLAMHRLLEGLKTVGVESKILCGTKTLADFESVEIPRSHTVLRVESHLRRITNRLGLNDIHCISTFGIRHHAAYVEADILNFHCLHEGFFNYLALPQLTSRKPAVLTLHDMWPLTGHCSYSYDCQRWKTGCGKCPYPDRVPVIQRDGTRWEARLKSWAYHRSNIAVVSPSKWLADLARESMLNCLPIHHIPYGVDTGVFYPRDREACRKALGIPLERKVILFASTSMGYKNDDGFRKGNDLLAQALQALPESLKADTTLLLLGARKDGFGETFGVPSIGLGYISDERHKAAAFSSADLFVLPTRADNLPLVLMESMASGTPMVSFRVGGIPDLVRPGITGYLAEPESAEDLCNGIVQLLRDEPLLKSMSQQCVEIAQAEFAMNLQNQRYLDLFNELLRSSRTTG